MAESSIPARQRTCPPILAGLASFALYLLASVFFFGRLVLLDPRHFYVGKSADPSIYIWALTWWPYAIRNGLNPFWTHAVWAPDGFNLAWATSVPGLSLSAWPITDLFGPIPAYNAIALIVPAINGWACYVLCKHLTKSFFPALFAGWIFAFSPYALGQMQAHLVEVLIFASPLAVYLVLLRLERRLSSYAYAVLLGLLLTFQLSLSTEIFATMTMFGAVAWILARWMDVVKNDDIRREVELPTIGAYVLVLILASPLLYYAFAFGLPAHNLNSAKAHSSDLLNFVLPTRTTLIHCPRALASVCDKFSTNSTEAAAYISPALIVVLVLWARDRRESGSHVLLILLAIVAFCSLGPRLHVAGYDLVGTPWKLVGYVPLIRDALPSRFMAYGFLIIAIISAMWLSGGSDGTTTKIGLALAAVIFLMPNTSAQFWDSSDDTPAFFRTAMYKQLLARDENVLTIPYGARGNCMLWQAAARMWFRMAGGHLGPNPPDAFARWPVVMALLNDTLLPDNAAQLEAFMGTHDVRAIIVREAYEGPWPQAIGALAFPEVSAGGMKLYRVPQEVLSKYRNANFEDFERRAELDTFSALLIAGAKYMSDKSTAAGLTPLVAQNAGLIPVGWVAPDDFGNRTHNGLWLGSWSESRIAVGVNATPETVPELTWRYGQLADAIYFPYPRKLGAPVSGDAERMLVMVFGREKLRRAAVVAASAPQP